MNVCLTYPDFRAEILTDVHAIHQGSSSIWFEYRGDKEDRHIWDWEEQPVRIEIHP